MLHIINVVVGYDQVFNDLYYEGTEEELLQELHMSAQIRFLRKSKYCDKYVTLYIKEAAITSMEVDNYTPNLKPGEVFGEDTEVVKFDLDAPEESIESIAEKVLTSDFEEEDRKIDEKLLAISKKLLLNFIDNAGYLDDIDTRKDAEEIVTLAVTTSHLIYDFLTKEYIDKNIEIPKDDEELDTAFLLYLSKEAKKRKSKK